MVFEAACGLLNHCSSRFDPKCCQREETASFSETDFEGMVFEAACGLLDRSGREFFVPNPESVVFDAALGCFWRIRRLSRKRL